MSCSIACTAIGVTVWSHPPERSIRNTDSESVRGAAKRGAIDAILKYHVQIGRCFDVVAATAKAGLRRRVIENAEQHRVD